MIVILNHFKMSISIEYIKENCKTIQDVLDLQEGYEEKESEDEI